MPMDIGRLLRIIFSLSLLSGGQAALGQGKLGDKGYCSANKYYVDPGNLCTHTGDSSKPGPPSWATQNRKEAGEGYWFSTCRGFNGQNVAYTNPITNRQICVETDKTACGVGCNRCSGQMTYEQAKKFCEGDMHARLCTEDELVKSCAERTGCDYDYTWVWSETSCVPDQSVPEFEGRLNGHLVAPGDMRKWMCRYGGKYGPASNPAMYDCGDKDTQLRQTWDKVSTGEGVGLPQSSGTFNNKAAHTNKRVGKADNFDDYGFGTSYITGPSSKVSMYETRFGLTMSWSPDLLDPDRKVEHRYSYIQAMNTETSGAGSAEKALCNPLDDANGLCCIPDSGLPINFDQSTMGTNDLRFYVRCCADHAPPSEANSDSCTNCPSGKVNIEGTFKNKETCIDPPTSSPTQEPTPSPTMWKIYVQDLTSGNPQSGKPALTFEIPLTTTLCSFKKNELFKAFEIHPAKQILSYPNEREKPTLETIKTNGDCTSIRTLEDIGTNSFDTLYLTETSLAPTEAPTSSAPTKTPTAVPTNSPTTESPTKTPTAVPTNSPTTQSPTIPWIKVVPKWDLDFEKIFFVDLDTVTVCDLKESDIANVKWPKEKSQVSRRANYFLPPNRQILSDDDDVLFSATNENGESCETLADLGVQPFETLYLDLVHIFVCETGTTSSPNTVSESLGDRAGKGACHRFLVDLTETVCAIKTNVYEATRALNYGILEADQYMKFTSPIGHGVSTPFASPSPNRACMLDNCEAVIGVDHGVKNGDVIYLLDPNWCPAGQYRAGSPLPCLSRYASPYGFDDVTGIQHQYGPGFWDVADPSAEAVTGKTSNRFDRCRGFDGSLDKPNHFADFKNPAGDFICVEADKDYGERTPKTKNGVCSGLVTHRESAAHCAKMGARLCTSDELRNSCAERTGCDYDYSWIWSSTMCVPDPRICTNCRGYWAAPGDLRKWHCRFSDCSSMKSTRVVDSRFDIDIVVPSQQTKGNVITTICKDTQTNVKVDYVTATNDDTDRYSCEEVTGIGVGMPNTVDSFDAKGYGDSKLFQHFAHWNSEGGTTRYSYMRAMEDLLMSEEFNDGALVKGASPLDDIEFGQICLPADDSHKLFTRCCADPKKYCTACPAGTTNMAGVDKTLETCCVGSKSVPVDRCDLSQWEEAIVPGCKGDDVLLATISPTEYTSSPTVPTQEATTHPTPPPTSAPTGKPTTSTPTEADATFKPTSTSQPGVDAMCNKNELFDQRNKVCVEVCPENGSRRRLSDSPCAVVAGNDGRCDIAPIITIQPSESPVTSTKTPTTTPPTASPSESPTRLPVGVGETYSPTLSTRSPTLDPTYPDPTPRPVVDKTGHPTRGPLMATKNPTALEDGELIWNDMVMFDLTIGNGEGSDNFDQGLSVEQKYRIRAAIAEADPSLDIEDVGDVEIIGKVNDKFTVRVPVAESPEASPSAIQKSIATKIKESVGAQAVLVESATPYYKLQGIATIFGLKCKQVTCSDKADTVGDAIAKILGIMRQYVEVEYVSSRRRLATGTATKSRFNYFVSVPADKTTIALTSDGLLTKAIKEAGGNIENIQINMEAVDEALTKELQKTDPTVTNVSLDGRVCDISTSGICDMKKIKEADLQEVEKEDEDKDDDDDSSLGAGPIIGIIIAILAVLVLLVFAAKYAQRKGGREKIPTDEARPYPENIGQDKAEAEDEDEAEVIENNENSALTAV